MPAPCDSSNSTHFINEASPLASGTGLQKPGKDSLSTGTWRLEEEQEIEQL